MEASALSHASRRGLLARRSPLLRLQADDRLVALVRTGNDSAFEVLWDRYRARLLAYCRSIVRSAEDAEDVLQDVFVNAHAAMVADQREIQVRPWLYRIARNRSLNHLRKPVADGQDSMDTHLYAGGETTHDDAERREDMRQLVADVKTLPETQRTALILREIDALTYDEIARAMETTIPSVKSLLVRARISLAEASESRLLICDDVRLELAAASEGLAKLNGAMRRHVRACKSCHAFRKQLNTDTKELRALAPIGLLALAQGLIAKLFGGSGAAGATGAAGAAAGSGAIAGGGGALLGGIGGAVGIKAAATAATAAIITAGAVEVSKKRDTGPPPPPAAATATHASAPSTHHAPMVVAPAATEGRDPAPARAAGGQSERPDAAAGANEPTAAQNTAEPSPVSVHEPGGAQTPVGGGGPSAPADTIVETPGHGHSYPPRGRDDVDSRSTDEDPTVTPPPTGTSGDEGEDPVEPVAPTPIEVRPENGPPAHANARANRDPKR